MSLADTHNILLAEIQSLREERQRLEHRIDAAKDRDSLLLERLTVARWQPDKAAELVAAVIAEFWHAGE